MPMEGISVNQSIANKSCYRCGTKGHLARFCPKAKQVIRQMMQAMRPEDKADLAREVALLKEDDFIGVKDDDYVDLLDNHETTDPSLFPEPEQ